MSAQRDYTIIDAYHDGFEAGLLYVLRYMDKDHPLNVEDVVRLASHLEYMKPWKSGEEWEELIRSNVARWR